MDTSPITLYRKTTTTREITLNSEIIQLEALRISKKLSRGLNSRDVKWIRHGLLYAIQILHLMHFINLKSSKIIKHV
jgi:hypothetical protein